MPIGKPGAIMREQHYHDRRCAGALHPALEMDGLYDSQTDTPGKTVGKKIEASPLAARLETDCLADNPLAACSVDG